MSSFRSRTALVVSVALLALSWGGCGDLFGIYVEPEIDARPAVDAGDDRVDPGDGGQQASTERDASPAVSEIDSGSDERVSVLKNSDFEVSPGAAIDLDTPSTFPPDFVASGGWAGAPNAPFNAIIANGYGTAGSRGVRFYRASGTSLADLPGVTQSIRITSEMRKCNYRVLADVLAETATAHVRLLLALDNDAGVHIGGLSFIDASAPAGQWETLLLDAPAIAADVTTLTLTIGGNTTDYFGTAYADNVRLEERCP